MKATTPRIAAASERPRCGSAAGASPGKRIIAIPKVSTTESAIAQTSGIATAISLPSTSAARGAGRANRKVKVRCSISSATTPDASSAGKKGTKKRKCTSSSESYRPTPHCPASVSAPAATTGSAHSAKQSHRSRPRRIRVSAISA